MLNPKVLSVANSGDYNENSKMVMAKIDNCIIINTSTKRNMSVTRVWFSISQLQDPEIVIQKSQSRN